MIDKHCLIIDDENQSVQINRLISLLRSEGINLTCKQINPNDYVTDNQEVEEIEIDNIKLLKDIKSEIMNGAVMIACDNNLGDILHGYELLYEIRNDLNFKHDIILYSGALDTLIKQILSTDNTFPKIKKLVETKISKFLRRSDTYIEDIKGILIKQSFDCQQEILNWLNLFEDHKFINSHPDFNNKNLKEIANDISNNTNDGIHFQRILIEQAISVMIELNIELKHE